MDFIDGKSIGVIGRQYNGLVLEYEKSILLTTDILRHNQDQKEPHITLSDVEKKIEIIADAIMLSGGSNHIDEPVVYGNALVETLKWIIGVLKTHSHPPNAPAIPDFHDQANSRLGDMEEYLLNKRVRTR